MKILLLRHWFSFTLSFLGLMSPAQMGRDTLMHMQQPVAVLVKTTQPKPVLKAQHPIRKAHKAHKTLPAPQASIKGLHYSYMLSGQAICDGKACVNATVEIRVTSENGAQIQTVRTDANGIYQLSMGLIGHPAEPVSFELTALTPDFQQLNMEGRQILTESGLVKINAPLHFVR